MYDNIISQRHALTDHGPRMNVAPEDGVEYEKMVGQMQKSIIQSIKDEGELSEDDTKIAEKAISDLMSVLQDTMVAGIFDSGAVLMMADDDVNFAAGVQIADPKKFEATVKVRQVVEQYLFDFAKYRISQLLLRPVAKRQYPFYRRRQNLPV